MNGNQTFTIECVKATSKFGETIYHNICTGGTSVVPWGNADWALAIVVGGLLGSVVIGILFALLAVVWDLIRW